jgi:hypothetical protein
VAALELKVEIGGGGVNVPLFVCFAAFVVTFVVTRVITRMIRAGKGPFHDNVSGSGLHIHHAVPGIAVLVTGAFLAVATDSGSARSIVAARREARRPVQTRHRLGEHLRCRHASEPDPAP